MMVRRLTVANTKYPSVSVLQQRYRAGAKINLAAASSAPLGEHTAAVKQPGKKKKFNRERRQINNPSASTTDATEPDYVCENSGEYPGKSLAVGTSVRIGVDQGISKFNENGEGGEEEERKNEDDVVAQFHIDGVPFMEEITAASSNVAAAEIPLISGQKRTLDDMSLPSAVSFVDVHIEDNPQMDVDQTEVKVPSVAHQSESWNTNTNAVSTTMPISTAFKRSRLRRNVEDIREKHGVTKKSTIWDLLSAPDTDDEGS